MHRAKWLAEHATPEGKKVLVTTFTRNLAIDLEANLNTLCAREVMSRIEVRNLDAWVLRFLRSKRYEQSIVYGRQNNGRVLQRALAVKDASLGLDDEFYAAELSRWCWRKVWRRRRRRAARRVGRGVMLSRAKRDAVWPVFEEYRAQLASRRLKEVDDAYRDAAQLIAKDRHYPYSAIVVDETQDFGPQALRLLRALIEPGKNDLFFVGDGHQRIYHRNKAAMSRSGIDIRGRARKLYLNYRTTDEIRRQAVALLEGVEVDDLDDGTDDNSRYKSLSHGRHPSCGLSFPEDLVTRPGYSG
jgi:superfamily I DNA/RNA helicase